MADEPTLKPCPCGASVELDGDGTTEFWVSCRCGIISGAYATAEEAIAAWNTRPVEDALRARIAELQTWAAAWKAAAKATRTEWRREKVSAGYLLRRYSELHSDYSVAQERIATLEHECRNYRALIDTHEELKAEHQARIAALEAALRFYADPDDYENDTYYATGKPIPESSVMAGDRGETARRAMKGEA